MLSALLYLQAVSLKNRLSVRFRRLRQPRYLFGAVVGGLYLAMMFSRSFLVIGRRTPAAATLPGMPDVWELVAALSLFVVLLFTWILPQTRAAMVFSEAEIAFLFPAPVRRSTLVRYKLFKSQLGVLFTAFFITAIAHRWNTLDGLLMRAAGWWILLSTIQLHTLGSSFARTILLERGVAHWQRRLAVGVIAALFIAGAFAWGAKEVPTPLPADIENLDALQGYLHKVAASAPSIWLLAPFRAVVRPFLATGFSTFATALGPALLILGLHYFWVIRSDVAFEEASVEASQRQAQRVADAIKTGQRTQGLRPWRKRKAPFPLDPLGPPAVAILWKNLLAAGQIFNARTWVSFLIGAAFLGYSIGQGAGRSAWPEILGLLAAMIAGWSVVLGPQFVRYDFRHDLAAADLLKSYPMKGWQVALGEILAPAMILTAIQWLLFTLVGVTRIASHGVSMLHHEYVALDNREVFALLALPLAAAIIAPMLNLLSLLIPNAAALLLPGWFAGPGANGSGRGIEVMGQRLIFILGQFVVVAVAVAPAALVFFLVEVLVADPFLGAAWSLPVCAVAASLVLAGEFCFGLVALGHWFENYDLSAEQLG